MTIIIFNNSYQRAGTKTLDKLAPGALGGRGVFETMLVVNRHVLFFNEHMLRMKRGLTLYKMSAPASNQKIHRYIQSLLRKNKLQNARLRVSAYREKGRRNFNIVVQKKSTVSAGGIRIFVSSKIRNRTKYSHIKSINYTLFKQALAEAKKSGFDEAVLLNAKGEVVEGATSNIFYVKNAIIFTPPVHCGCLNGVTRNAVLKLARLRGYSCRIKAFKTEQLLNADEVFVTNSLVGILPVLKINQYKIKQGRAGAVTKELILWYKANLTLKKQEMK